MSLPDFDAKPTGKTLLDLAEERHRELTGNGQPFPKQDDASADKDGDWEFMSTEPLGAFPTAILYGVSLSVLHITLDVLVLSQYRQEVEWPEIFWRMARMTPALFVLLYLFHTPTALRFKLPRQLFFLALSVGAGAYMLYAGNEHGYYFVMRRAPPLGVLWVWSVVEMDLMYALIHLLAVGSWTWYKGYGSF